MNRIKIGKTGRAYVVDSSGILVAHPDDSLVLKKTDLSSLSQVQAALVSPAGSGDQAGVTIERDVQHRRVLTTHHRIEPVGWQVFVEQPVSEAFAPLYASVARFAFLLFLGLLLAVVTSLFLARRMVSPILALQAHAGRIGAGELDQRIDLHTGDELEQLGKVLNHMAERLGESYASLEQKVAELTRTQKELNLSFTLPLHLLGIAGNDGYFKRLNPAFEATLGFINLELMAVPFLDFVHPEDLGTTIAELEKLANGATTIRFENRYRCKDGAYKWLDWSAIPVTEEGLTYLAALDITDRKLAEEALERLDR